MGGADRQRHEGPASYEVIIDRLRATRLGPRFRLKLRRAGP